MASGTIELNQSHSSGGYIDSKIVWSSSKDSNANNSDCTATLYVRKDSTETTLTQATVGTWTYALTINGSRTSGSIRLSVLTDWVKVVSATVNDIGHNSDGTKSITISGSVSAPSGTKFDGHTTSGSGTATFDTIPRASTITSAANVTLGNNCSVKWTPASTSFRYKLKLSLGDWSYTTGAIHPNTTSAYTYTGYTIPIDVSNQITVSKTDTMTVVLYTYSNSGATTQVGSSSSKTFTVTVPDNSSTRPTVEPLVSSVHSLPGSFSGLFIQGKSKVRVFPSAEEGKYGASIEDRYMSVDGKNYGSSVDYTSGYLSKYGEITVTGYATDSRGITGSAKTTIDVVAYTRPKVVAVSGEKSVRAYRCDVDGNAADNGNYIRIKAKRSFTVIRNSAGDRINLCELRYRYKAESASSYSSWQQLLSSDYYTEDEIITDPIGTFDTTTSYMIQIGVVDTVGETDNVTITIPTEKIYMHRAGSMNSLGIGKYVEEENCIDIDEAINVKIRGGVEFLSEGWVNLRLSSKVSASESNFGRHTNGGCYYRVCDGGKHVYIAFNCAFTYEGSALYVGSDAIPKQYRPARNVYAMCATGGRNIARVFVNNSGGIGIDWVQSLTSASQTTSASVSWIDGYIDYWI